MVMLTFTAYRDILLLTSAKGAPFWRLSVEGLDPGAGEGKEEPQKQGGFNLLGLF